MPPEQVGARLTDKKRGLEVCFVVSQRMGSQVVACILFGGSEILNVSNKFPDFVISKNPSPRRHGRGSFSAFIDSFKSLYRVKIIPIDEQGGFSAVAIVRAGGLESHFPSSNPVGIFQIDVHAFLPRRRRICTRSTLGIRHAARPCQSCRRQYQRAKQYYR